jgi:phosphatidylglycerol:prolipoprotein diacylglycerol transferase
MFPGKLMVIHGFAINPYLLFHGLGFIPAIILGLWLARERSYPLGRIAICAVLAVTGALVAGPAIVVILRGFLPKVPHGWALAQLAGAMIYLWAYVLFHPRPFPEPLSDVGDILFPPIALYIAIARLGCFSAGCCHGIPAWDLPWAVTFTNPHSACIFKGIPVHPTQLYEASGCFLLCCVLMALRNRPFWKGKLGALFFMGYGLLRFVIEFYRGEVRQMVGPLSLTQVFCLGIIFLVGVTLVFEFFKKRPLKGTEHFANEHMSSG